MLGVRVYMRCEWCLRAGLAVSGVGSLCVVSEASDVCVPVYL